MADQTLTEALSGLNMRGIDTPWGIGALTLGQNAGSFINPYGSWGSNLAIGLGTSLLTALLGYQAKQSALEQNLALQPGITAALKATSMEDLDRIMAQPEYQRLGTIGTELKTSLLARQAAAAEKANEFKQALQIAGIKEGYIPRGMEGLFTTPTTGLRPSEQRQVDLEIAKKTALNELEKPIVAQNTFDQLRKEFNALQEVKDYSTVSKAAETVAKAVKDPSAVAAAELAKRAIQLIEPGLAVQVGEQRAIEQSQSIPEELKAQLKKALVGQGGFSDQLRQDILNLARRSYDAQTAKYEQARTFYQGQLNQRNIAQDISYLGTPKSFDYYIENANQPSGAARLNEIARLIKAETNPVTREALRTEAKGIYARLKGG